jgi:hypothetical protein
MRIMSAENRRVETECTSTSAISSVLPRIFAGVCKVVFIMVANFFEFKQRCFRPSSIGKKINFAKKDFFLYKASHSEFFLVFFSEQDCPSPSA